MYKRIISLLLAVLVLAGLCACRRKAPASISDVYADDPPVTKADAAPEPSEDNGGDHAQSDKNAAPQEAQTVPESIADTNTVIVSVTPGVEASLGVVEGDAVSDLDENDLPNNPATAPPAPAQEPQELPQSFDITAMTYESYNAMSGSQQQEVINQFASPEEFMKWYNAVKELYETENPGIEIGGDGVIDMSTLGQ